MRVNARKYVIYQGIPAVLCCCLPRDKVEDPGNDQTHADELQEGLNTVP